jgi:hypothetical protein
MCDTDKYGLFIPAGVSVSVVGGKFYSDEPRTEYERQVVAAMHAALDRAVASTAGGKQ